MKWLIFLSALLLFFVFEARGSTAKVLNLKDNQVATIKTAPGYSTILQFESRPTSVILGDQDAFKVEYIGTGITIKPILRSSKSNLFVFTNYDRFNFKLVTANAADIDYVVQVKRKNELPKKNIKAVNKKVASQGIELLLKKAEILENKDLSITFSFSSKKRKNVRVIPQSFGVFQGTKWLTVENLTLSSFDLPMTGTMTINSSDFEPNQIMTVIAEPFSRSKKLKPLHVSF